MQLLLSSSEKCIPKRPAAKSIAWQPAIPLSLANQMSWWRFCLRCRWSCYSDPRLYPAFPFVRWALPQKQCQQVFSLVASIHRNGWQLHFLPVCFCLSLTCAFPLRNFRSVISEYSKISCTPNNHTAEPSLCKSLYHQGFRGIPAIDWLRGIGFGIQAYQPRHQYNRETWWWL